MYVSETKYLKYQQNIEGNISFRKCENILSLLAQLHFFERLMEIHSNPPILYYGFKKKCVILLGDS